MAKVTFRKGQPIQALSGTLGALTFRTLYGRTFVRERSMAVLPENPTRKQRAQYKQRKVVDRCVEILQYRIPDIQEAIAIRPKMRERVKYLYKKFAPEIKAPTKLQKRILEVYEERFE